MKGYMQSDVGGWLWVVWVCGVWVCGVWVNGHVGGCVGVWGVWCGGGVGVWRWMCRSVGCMVRWWYGCVEVRV